MVALPIESRASPSQFLGMPVATFLRDYWQKRPLLVRSAFATFVAPLTPEDLAGLACEETALSRIVRHDPRSDRWELRQGPFREDEFPGMPQRDWTLLVQDVDKWDGDVAALLAHFAFLPRWRIDDVMVSFAAPGGSVGAHVDQYDVFLLQGLGQRRWQIDAGPAPSTAFRDDVELKLLREFHPTHDWILEPGDMLYLPPGVPHHGVAVDACLTFSIGMRAPARSELMADFAEFLAEQWPENERYSDPDLDAGVDPGEIDAAAIERVKAALPALRFEAGSPRFPHEEAAAGAIPDATLRSWFGRFITRYRSAGEIAAPPRAPSAAQIAERLAAGATLHRHPFSRAAWTRTADGAELFVDGDGYGCSVATARRLADPASLDAVEYASLDASGRALLHDLCARGGYALSRVPRKPVPRPRRK
jgi:50S ribosomal protein L16 3-hydroxylase